MGSTFQSKGKNEEEEEMQHDKTYLNITKNMSRKGFMTGSEIAGKVIGDFVSRLGRDKKRGGG